MERQTDRHADRHGERKTQTERYRHVYRRIGKQTVRETNKQTKGETGNRPGSRRDHRTWAATCMGSDSRSVHVNKQQNHSAAQQSHMPTADLAADITTQCLQHSTERYCQQCVQWLADRHSHIQLPDSAKLLKMCTFKVPSVNHVPVVASVCV